MNSSIPFGKPNLSEEELLGVSKVLNSGILVHGEYTKKFEEAFAIRANVKNAVSVSSCTAGLHLSLFVNNIGPGDRVAVPAMTHVSTAHVIELQRATPVFIDVKKETGNMDPELLSDEIKKGPLKAIMPVHYLGLACEMDEINNLAKESNAIVIEDCALSLDGTYKGTKTGALGDCGCFSFYPVKHMTTIEGGIVTTNNDDLAKKIRKARAFGYNKELGARSRAGLYDVDKLGFNYRMNEVEAMVGLVQIKKLDNSLKIRERNYQIINSYLDRCEEIYIFPNEINHSKSSYYCLNIVFKNSKNNYRDKLQDFLKQLNIGTSIHYPSAVPLFSYYKKKYNYKVEDFPVSNFIGNNTLSIPLAKHITEDDANKIGNSIYNFLKGKRS